MLKCRLGISSYHSNQRMLRILHLFFSVGLAVISKGNRTEDYLFQHGYVPAEIKQFVGEIDTIVGKLSTNNTFVNNTFNTFVFAHYPPMQSMLEQNATADPWWDVFSRSNETIANRTATNETE
jgi:hypothetical protein